MSGERTIIRATCACCGTVDVDPKTITLRVRAGQNHQEWNHYWFTCPKCGDVITKRAPLDVVMLLTDGGVVIEKVVFPLEVDEPIRYNLAPITPDEILDAILDIDRELAKVMNP